MELFYNIFTQSAFLFILYKTNVVYEYIKYFKLNITKEYESYLIANKYLNFIEYLGFKNNFIFRLIACPLCLNFWLSIITCLISNNILYIGVIYIISLLIMFILSHFYGKFEY